MHTRASEGQHERESSGHDHRLQRRASRMISRAAPGSPLAVLAEGAALRERTVGALARVVAAGAARVPGDTRTRKLLRRAEVARQELSKAEFTLAEAWRTGDRQARSLRAISRLRGGVDEQRARLLETPDGLLAAKEADLVRYEQELRRTRFALTPSREEAVHELLRAVVQGRPVLMLGPSGTGKTTLVKELARRLGVDDPEIIPGNEVTSGQLWGTRGLDPVKGDVIRDGIVARAMVGGKLLLWDEANASEEAMEKFLKFKAYLTTRPGDRVRVPPEHPDLRPVSPRFAFLLTGNPKGEKHKTRAEFPPEVARELGEVTLDYLPEDELYDLCVASLADGGVLPLAAEELRADGPLHALVKLVAEVQRLYLGRSEARGTDTAATLRRLVIDPGMVTAWLQGWAFEHASAGASLATYFDRRLLALVRSEKYPAEDRAILAQTANRFRFLATADGKATLAAAGVNADTLTGAPFPKDLYAEDRDGTTTFADAVLLHPYLQAQLDARFNQLLMSVGERGGMDVEKVRGALLGIDTTERIAELRALALLDPATLRERLGDSPDASAKGAAAPHRVSEQVREGQLSLEALAERLQAEGLDIAFRKGPLIEQVRKYAASVAAGSMGFALDERALTFPEAKIAELRSALLSGAVDGIVVTAYPTREQVDAIANRTAINVENLLNLPVTEFWICLFEYRGGRAFDRDSRLVEWRRLRWPSDGSLVDPATYASLPEQPRLRDVLGRAQLSFTATVRDVALTAPIVQSAPPGDEKYVAIQGEGLTYDKLREAGARILAPDEWLAMAATSNPLDIDTYLSPDTSDWLSGVVPAFAANAYSVLNGLSLDWDVPHDSNARYRARSVIRGTLGLQGVHSAPDVKVAANEGRGAGLDVRGAWGVGQLRQWLKSEGLEEKLEGGSLDHWLWRAMDAYADGALGFLFDHSAIRFEATPEKLARLKAGIETGLITGAVVVAYPTEEDLYKAMRMTGRSARENRKRLKQILAMPVTEFLAEHFSCRSGILFEKEIRIKAWRELRWPTDDGESLRERFFAESKHASLDPAHWGTLVREYIEVHKDVYEELPPQPKLETRLGRAKLTFMDTRKEVPLTAKLLRSDGTVSIYPQGEGLSFVRLLQEDVPLPTPTEFLALASILAEPKDPSTYPNPGTWEWLGAITPRHAACGDSFPNFELELNWGAPEGAITANRARAVVHSPLLKRI